MRRFRTAETGDAQAQVVRDEGPDGRRMFGEGLGFWRLGFWRPGFGRRGGPGQMRRRGEAEHAAERAQQFRGLRGGGAEGGDVGVVQQHFDARGVLRQRLMQADQPGMAARGAAGAPGLGGVDFARRGRGAEAAAGGAQAVVLPACGETVETEQGAAQADPEQQQQRR